MNIEVVHSPALLPLFSLKGKVVVVIDILRATSTMCVAFKMGVKQILPVATTDECRIFKEFDFLIAAERNAQKVDGFDLGNSPFEYENPLLEGRRLAFTTTNGTKAIRMAREQEPYKILVGSFLNLTALCERLRSEQREVVLLCSGWKDKYNLEDTFFAGAVMHHLGADATTDDDAAVAALNLYLQHQHDAEEFIGMSSHAQRFRLLHLQTDDVRYCLQMDTCNLVPEMDGEFLVVKNS